MSTINWVQQALAPELTEPEKELRDRFAVEYLVDYSPVDAALRMGLDIGFAKVYSRRFLQEPYVQQKISELEKKGGATDDIETNRNRVQAALFREANYMGPGSSPSARVAALAKLMSLFGMDAPIKTSAEVTLHAPVQFYLPDNGRDACVVTQIESGEGNDADN